MNALSRYWRTVRRLRFRQLIYQVIHRLRPPAKLHLPTTNCDGYFLTVLAADKRESWRDGTFLFLNQSVRFGKTIDWNYDAKGKLWTYHLTYFDFLNQPTMAPTAGIALIRDFIARTETVRTGLEPYPTSIRIVNWIQFLSRHKINNAVINQHLWAQVALVSQRLEYHLSGNHLLENGFALLMGAVYFRHKRWFRKAHRLVQQELTEQILADGGHYERSPVYHQLLLDRLLTVVLSLRVHPPIYDAHFVTFLVDQATRMLGWIKAITLRNGIVPMMSDAAPDVAPTTAQLKRKADFVLPNHNSISTTLTASGYRLFRRSRYELVANVGSVGPAHQPGHAHADTFSFVLNVDNRPCLVDTGVSTYEPGHRRQWERSTAAHNTVTINDTDSSEVWATFRVGRRARTKLLTDTPNQLTARHDGYESMGCLHERTWQAEATCLVIRDRLLPTQATRTKSVLGTARFYFHPTVELLLDASSSTIRAGPLLITCQSATKLKFVVKRSQVADGFNRLSWNYGLEVTFTADLTTTLTFTE